MKTRALIVSLSAASILLAACGVRAAQAPAVLEGKSGAIEAPLQLNRSAVSQDTTAAQPGFGGAPSGGGAPVPDRLVIRNANLSLVVHDPTASIDKISALAEELGGFVVTSNVFEATFGDNVKANQASITIRVPAEKFNDAIKQITADAIEVRNKNISGEDVTQQYTDLQSRLRNLEAAEEQLREIMASATKTEDVMMVYNQLVQVRGEIEQVKGQMQYFEQSARLSAISADLIPDIAAQPIEIGGWRPQGTAKMAVQALIKTLQFLADAGIWAVICVLPIALLFGIPAYFVIRAIVRRRRAAKARQVQPA
jgi:hypothetical protein